MFLWLSKQFFLMVSLVYKIVSIEDQALHERISQFR